MTEKEMMNQMQNLLGIRKKPSEKEAAAIALADSVDELAEMFCDSAIVLSRIASLLQGKNNPWDTKNFEDMDDWDEEDMACMDATREIMNEVKKGDLERVTFRNEQLRKYFPRSYTTQQMQDTIIKLLDQWQKKKARDQER